MNKIESAKIFQARYDYGPKEEQIAKKSNLANFFQTIITRPFKAMVFTGASFLKGRYIDVGRVEKAKKQLVELFGGEVVKMKTPDGDLIDGVYLSTQNLKKNFEKYFVIHEKINQDGRIQQTLVLKPEYSEVKTKTDDFTIMKPTEEANIFVNQMKQFMSVGERRLISEENGKKVMGIAIELPSVPNDSPTSREDNESNPTMLFAGAARMTYSCYHKLAIAYLLRGINVMMFDYRGFGRAREVQQPIKQSLILKPPINIYLKKSMSLMKIYWFMDIVWEEVLLRTWLQGEKGSMFYWIELLPSYEILQEKKFLMQKKSPTYLFQE